jgi:FkbM family methyltransferase
MLAGAGVVKRVLRAAQTFFPGLQDFRFRIEARLLHALDRPFSYPYFGLRAFHVDNPLFVDIGAHRGLSISTLRTMKPDARIIGFEPNYILVEQVRAFFKNDPKISVEAFGLGDKRHELTLYVPVYRGFRFDGLASVDKDSAQNWLSADRLLGFDPAKLVIEEMRVQIRTLDEFELAPFLVKIYTPGHVREVITGAKKTIDKHQPVILAPKQQPSADALLRDLGYRRFSWIANKFVAEADIGYVVFYLAPAHVRDLELA